MIPGQSSGPPQPASGEWDELRARLRQRLTQVIDLITILLQDAVILLVGFLAEFAVNATETPQLQVVEHWFDELTAGVK